jgi:hypothetical protein
MSDSQSLESKSERQEESTGGGIRCTELLTAVWSPVNARKKAGAIEVLESSADVL